MIGAKAFRKCKNIKFINFKNCKAIRSIGDEAFMMCKELGGVDLAGSAIEEIGSLAFAGCSGVKVFDISKCDLIAYANGGYYPLEKKIGKFGYSVQKKSKTAKNSKINAKRTKNKIK